MSTSDILVLVGQVVQVISGFILSVEAIGLDRVAKLANSLSLLHRDLVDEKQDRPFFSRGSQIPRLVVALSIGVVGTVCIYVVRHMRPGIKLSSWGVVTLSVVVGLITATVGATLWQALIYSLRGTVWGLRHIESRSTAKTSGVLGFLLLLLGFLLQFIGTIGQTISK